MKSLLIACAATLLLAGAAEAATYHLPANLKTVHHLAIQQAGADHQVRRHGGH